MVSKALLYIIDHDVLGEGFMQGEISGTEIIALQHAYKKLEKGNLGLTGFQTATLERAVNRFKQYYTPTEQLEITQDMRQIRAIQERYTPVEVKRARRK